MSHAGEGLLLIGSCSVVNSHGEQVHVKESSVMWFNTITVKHFLVLFVFKLFPWVLPHLPIAGDAGLVYSCVLLKEVCPSFAWSASAPVTYVGIPHCR